MARVRKIEIENFRSIKALVWTPSPGLNCLIGRGDSGKSTLLEALDLCLGARRSFNFSDSDFYKLDIGTPIRIIVTLGDLDDSLKNFEMYGLYLRGYNQATGEVEDEPRNDLETVLSVLLKVESDLEPLWALVSERATAHGNAKNLMWADRVRLAPTRLGALAHHHLGWGRGSVLNRISDERADASAVLAKAARDARDTFENETKEKLADILTLASTTAKELGIPVGNAVRAMLDAHSASFSGGTISLHDADGVPLSNLGLGSTRLMVAGLQRKAAQKSTLILIDELEHGLEPQRIIRLLDSLGAKEKDPPLQVFMSTHSPVAVRELSGAQLFVLRSTSGVHGVIQVGADNGIQGTVRLFPEAFLASSVIVCEGASEVGLLRGLDQYHSNKGTASIAASGVALVDAAGESKIYDRAISFQKLKYRVAVLRDDDTQPSPETEAAFVAAGGKVVAWRDGRALEDEFFFSLPDRAIQLLLDRAIDLHGEALVNEHIKSASRNSLTLEICRGASTPEIRKALGKASKAKKAGWFKSVTWMEAASRDIVAPHLHDADQGFQKLVDGLFDWTHGK